MLTGYNYQWVVLLCNTHAHILAGWHSLRSKSQEFKCIETAELFGGIVCRVANGMQVLRCELQQKGNGLHIWQSCLQHNAAIWIFHVAWINWVCNRACIAVSMLKEYPGLQALCSATLKVHPSTPPSLIPPSNGFETEKGKIYAGSKNTSPHKQGIGIILVLGTVVSIKNISSLSLLALPTGKWQQLCSVPSAMSELATWCFSILLS